MPSQLTRLLCATVFVAGAVMVPSGVAAAAEDLPGATKGPCQYTETPDDPAARPIRLPRDPAHTPSHGTVKVKLRTSQGPIGLTLDRAKAPCTVQSFLHLARHGFYDVGRESPPPASESLGQVNEFDIRDIANVELTAQLIRITAAGLKESHPHDITCLKGRLTCLKGRLAGVRGCGRVGLRGLCRRGRPCGVRS